MLGQFNRERRVPAAMLSQSLSIEVDRGCRHHRTEVQEKPPAAHIRRWREVAAVHGDELVVSVLKAMPGQEFIRVGYGHALEARVIEFELCALRCCLPAIMPISIHRVKTPAHDDTSKVW